MLLLGELVFLFEQTLATLLDAGIARLGTVVKTAEDLVPWRFVGTVVAVTKAMVQLMHEITELQTEKAGQADAVITAVRGRPSDGVQHRVKIT